MNDKDGAKLSGAAEDRYPITMRLRPWLLMRAFWGGAERSHMLANILGQTISHVYKLMQEFGAFGNGRKSDLHRVCEQIENATFEATNGELTAVREMAAAPMRVYEEALAERQQREGHAGIEDAQLFDALSGVIRVRSHGRPWEEQRREMARAVAILEQEMKAGDQRSKHNLKVVGAGAARPQEARKSGGRRAARSGGD